MPLASTGDIVHDARDRRSGVGALNVTQLEHAEAVVAGAQSAERPVVVQISENCVRHHGDLAPFALACKAIAASANVPVGLHLDHAESPDLVWEALDLGFTSVMYDGSRLDYEQNVSHTRTVAERCAAAGVWAEAELGEIGGKDGAHARGVRTDPAEASAFVAATQVDALAVAVGSSHAMTRPEASLDFDLVRELRGRLPVPLVLHGSSGVGDGDLARAVAAGLTKINVATRLNQAFTATLRDYLAEDPEVVDPRRYTAAARAAMADAVAKLLRILDP